MLNVLNWKIEGLNFDGNRIERWGSDEYNRVATAKFKIKIQSFIRVFSECFSVFFRVSQRKNQSFADLLTCVVKKNSEFFQIILLKISVNQFLSKKHAAVLHCNIYFS